MKRLVADEDDRRVNRDRPVILALFQMVHPEREAFTSAETDESGHQPVFGFDCLGQRQELRKRGDRALRASFDGCTFERAGVRPEQPIIDCRLQDLSEKSIRLRWSYVTLRSLVKDPVPLANGTGVELADLFLTEHRFEERLKQAAIHIDRLRTEVGSRIEPPASVRTERLLAARHVERFTASEIGFCLRQEVCRISLHCESGRGAHQDTDIRVHLSGLISAGRELADHAEYSPLCHPRSPFRPLLLARQALSVNNKAPSSTATRGFNGGDDGVLFQDIPD
jgi:hypothetical protein